MIEDKKKSKAFPTFVLLLAIILIGLGVACQFGYLDPVLEKIGLKEKTTKKSTNKETTNNNSTIEEGALDISSEQVTNLYKKVSNTTSKKYSTYYFEQDKLLVENMDNAFRLMLAFNNTVSTSDTDSRTDEQMKTSYSDLFGSVEYKAEDFDSNCMEYKYDSKTTTYTKSSSTACTSSCNAKKEAITSAYQYADRIEITTIVAFVDTCNFKYYKDYKYSNKVLEGVEYNNTTLEDNKDKFDHYIYTFTLKDNNYVFTGVSKEV